MEIIERLQSIPLFRDVRPETLTLLATMVKTETYYPAEEIVAQGDLAKKFFVANAGIINLRETAIDGTEKSVGIITSGDIAGLSGQVKNYFGEQMFTSQEPYEYHATAIDQVQVFVIERGDFDALVLQYPKLLDDLPFIRQVERERTRGYEWVVEGERVIKVVHRHWYVLLPGALQVLLAFIAVVAVNAMMRFLLLDGAWLLVGAGLLIVPILLAAFIVYDWRNDDFVVTNQRVAHVERVFFFERELRESIPIDKIVSVAIESEGIRSYLQASTLIIQSAGRVEGNVTFDNIPDAKQVRKLIQDQQSRLVARTIARQRELDRLRIQTELREYMLPHVVAQERAAVEAARPKMPPPRPPTWRDRVRRLVGQWLNLELRQGRVITWRKHWIVLFDQAKMWFGGLVALMLFFVFIAFNPRVPFAATGGYLFGGLMLIAICLGGLWWQWEDWRNDTYALTETQIVDAERLPLGLKEKTITATLDQVQDVKVDVPSFWANILNYGDVRIETAGKSGEMIFHAIHNPRSVSDEIFRRLDEYRKRKEERESNLRNRGVIDALIGYDRLRKEEAKHQDLAKDQPPARGQVTVSSPDQADAPLAKDAEEHPADADADDSSAQADAA